MKVATTALAAALALAITVPAAEAGGRHGSGLKLPSIELGGGTEGGGQIDILKIAKVSAGLGVGAGLSISGR